MVAAPSVTTATLLNGEVTVAYSQTLVVTGGAAPYTWSLSAGTLPRGLSLSAAGVISGTPSRTGTSTFTVKVLDALGAAATQALSITVAAAPSIPAVTLPSSEATVAYSQTLAATGGVTPYTWSVSAGTLPGGLTLSAAGVISGTPTNAGTFNFTVLVTNARTTTATRALSITVAAAPSVTTATLAAGLIGTAYSQTLAATNGTTPYTWSVLAGALPGGLTLSTAGVISGTPTNAGTFNFTVRVRDANGVTATGPLSITVGAVAAPSNVTVAAARNGTTDMVTLTWVDNASNETGFTVQRATNAGFTTGLATATAPTAAGTGTTVTFTQTGVARRTTFYYRVQAVNGASASAWVNATPSPVTTP